MLYFLCTWLHTSSMFIWASLSYINFILCFHLCEWCTCSQHFVLPHQQLLESGRRCLAMRCPHFWAGEGALSTLPAHAYSNHPGVRHLWLLLLGTSEAWGFGVGIFGCGQAQDCWCSQPPLVSWATASLLMDSVTTFCSLSPVLILLQLSSILFFFRWKSEFS